MTRLIGPIAALLLLMGLAASGADNTSVYAQGSLSPPTDVTAADGDNPREAKLTWEPVIDADYYRIGWVDYADLQAATDAGLEWLEAFVFVDVSNRGQTSYTVTGLEPGAYHAFIVGTAESRFGVAQWSEWATLTLRSDPTPSTGQPQVPGDATLLIIPDPPTVDCYVGLRLSPGQGCIWPEPELNPQDPSDFAAYQTVSQGGDYHGQFISTWRSGSIWIEEADSDAVRLTTSRGGGGSRFVYRFWADREANDVWVVTKVNELVE